ncbi:MAG: hypothetical protein DMG97_36515 [Acidobacteria bacterium]|nr:MAG: hypothetical protein DMG97_36515 [Acidobacteriota bacterium]
MIDQETFRRAMGCFATGVTVITVDYEGTVQGMTANAFSSVSLDPLLVLVCVDQKARTHAHLHARKRFGINVLSEQQRAISEHYAQPDRDPSRAEQAAGARFDRTPHGTPVLQGALAYLECRLQSAQDAAPALSGWLVSYGSHHTHKHLANRNGSRLFWTVDEQPFRNPVREGLPTTHPRKGRLSNGDR